MGFGDVVIARVVQGLTAGLAPIETGRFPRTVYHYTSQDGLLAILRDHKIWATAVEYLNDSKECVYLSEVASQFVRERSDTLFAGIEDPIAYWMLDGFATRRDSRIFVACFCANGDRLSQWRGYADAGLGVSLGFATQALRKLAIEHDGRRIAVRFGRCLYSEAVLRKTLQRCCQRVVQEYHAMKRGGAKPNVLPLAIGSISGLMISHLAPFHKHPEFREEQEWRLVVTLPPEPSPLVHVRRGRTTVTPYLEIPLADAERKLSLNKVIVGPNPNAELARRGVWQALASFSAVEPLPDDGFVVSSAIPFRTW